MIAQDPSTPLRAGYVAAATGVLGRYPLERESRLQPAAENHP
jgi:hypothetical protein